ncbi:MAG TPA: alanine racemase [Candidatus Paceibacterota bacterium]|nr:alanine racemase [Candidatus Paceibacterota bacterium]
MSIWNGLRYLRERLSPRRPLVEVGISRANLLHNLRTYQERYQHVRIAPVLKSNAYGHDMGLVARLLDKEDVAFFMVDSLYEARRLRRAGVKTRIVVMGYVRPIDPELSTLADIDFAITDVEQLREIAALLTRPVRFHLKVDTGMHRQGIMPRDLPEALALVKSNPRVQVVGVCSHLADADGEGDGFSETQVETWLAALTEVEKIIPVIEYRHLVATKGVRFAERARTNVARVGIGLYGFDTSRHDGTAVRPVLELRSFITSLRDIPDGDHVGYNAVFHATRASRIATVPVGYFEGYDRRLSSKGSMLVRGVPCPVAGRISMNMSSLDVTDCPSAKRGDPVTVISRDPAASNSIERIRDAVSNVGYTESEYALLVHIPPHLRRVVE